jgi:hypothetical protein
MIAFLLGAAGFLLVLTLAAVYSAFVLAHRTDDLVAGMGEESGAGSRQALGHV